MSDHRDPLRSLAAVRPEAFARALVEAVRSLAGRTPAPRVLPFFGLDHPEACGSRLLDRLSDLGIFRFYEQVLDLGSGLGGPARWLARRRGCRVVSASSRVADARAAAGLTRRAVLDGQVSFACARPADLPFRDAAFTHVWSVLFLHRETDKKSIFRESFRVVRPGGYVAIQDWVLERGGSPAESFVETPDLYREALYGCGFADVKITFADELTEEEDGGAVAEILRERLRTSLAAVEEEARDDLEHELLRQRAIREARLTGRIRLAQIFAARPS